MCVRHLGRYGDLMDRFVASNKRYGLRSGIYYLGWGNFFMNVTNENGVYDCAQDTPQTREFFEMQLCHLEELYSKYEFSEIWFDGGAPCHKDYEAAIANLTRFYQNRAVAFQGPLQYPNGIRWIGTESGTSPDDTWSTSDDSQAYGAGSKDGKTWVPVGCRLDVHVGIVPACLCHSSLSGGRCRRLCVSIPLFRWRVLTLTCQDQTCC